MGGRTIKCIWHCFLIDKGPDRYLSPSARPVSGDGVFIDQKSVPYAYLLTQHNAAEIDKIVDRRCSFNKIDIYFLINFK